MAPSKSKTAGRIRNFFVAFTSIRLGPNHPPGAERKVPATEEIILFLKAVSGFFPPSESITTDVYLFYLSAYWFDLAVGRQLFDRRT
jgi:hypothetical protein